MATQHVKDFTFHLFVGPTTETVKRRTKISLNTATGHFSVPVPKEIRDVLGLNEETLRTRTLDELPREFEQLLARYKVATMNATREKVIVVRYRRKIRGHFRGEKAIVASFTTDRVPDTHIGLEHEVLVKVGDHIYEQHFDDAAMQHRMRMPDPSNPTTRVIPWTEEREAFFVAVEDGIATLIQRLDAFLEQTDLTARIDQAVARGGGIAALPAPEHEPS